MIVYYFTSRNNLPGIIHKIATAEFIYKFEYSSEESYKLYSHVSNSVVVNVRKFLKLSFCKDRVTVLAAYTHPTYMYME